MYAAMLAIFIAGLISWKFPIRFAGCVFAITTLLLLPVSGYIIIGLQTVMQNISGWQIVIDMISLSGQTLLEPFKYIAYGMPTANLPLLIVGCMVWMGIIVSGIGILRNARFRTRTSS